MGPLPGAAHKDPEEVHVPGTMYSFRTVHVPSPHQTPWRFYSALHGTGHLIGLNSGRGEFFLMFGWTGCVLKSLGKKVTIKSNEKTY